MVSPNTGPEAKDIPVTTAMAVLATDDLTEVTADSIPIIVLPCDPRGIQSQSMGDREEEEDNIKAMEEPMTENSTSTTKDASDCVNRNSDPRSASNSGRAQRQWHCWEECCYCYCFSCFYAHESNNNNRTANANSSNIYCGDCPCGTCCDSDDFKGCCEGLTECQEGCVQSMQVCCEGMGVFLSGGCCECGEACCNSGCECCCSACLSGAA